MNRISQSFNNIVGNWSHCCKREGAWAWKRQSRIISNAKFAAGRWPLQWDRYDRNMGQAGVGEKSGVRAQPSDSPCAESYNSPPYKTDFTSFPGHYSSVRHLVASNVITCNCISSVLQGFVSQMSVNVMLSSFTQQLVKIKSHRALISIIPFPTTPG